jgi:hypothetical protein
MKIVAKNMILTNDTKSVSFEVRRANDVAYIDYYDNAEFVYQLECPIQQANKIYKQCIFEGYQETI